MITDPYVESILTARTVYKTAPAEETDYFSIQAADRGALVYYHTGAWWNVGHIVFPAGDEITIETKDGIDTAMRWNVKDADKVAVMRHVSRAVGVLARQPVQTNDDGNGDGQH